MHKISKGIFAQTGKVSLRLKAKNKPFTMCAMFLFNLIGIPYIRIYERNMYIVKQELSYTENI